MNVAAIVALVAVGTLVLALAYYLVTVIVLLRRLIDTLGKITFGLRAIAHRTEPVNGIVAEIVEDLAAVDAALSVLVETKRGGERAS
ncbi:MAG TPA: hypothetical protein ENK55_09935 [Actinobacteria bacterium]|nr:hypothetical protein [Actinomycetota bacterium]